MLGWTIVKSRMKAPTHRAVTKNRDRGLVTFRLVARLGFSILLALAVTLVGPRLGADETPEPDCTVAQTRINLVFIIDRSGSLADRIDPSHENNSGRGQTYNVEIEGVRRALLDSSVMPRDGSVSVGAVLFDGAASVALPLTSPIGSDAEAEAIAAQIQTLHCFDLNGGIDPCPAGDTDFDAAIRRADQIARSRSGARRVLIMSTDGGASDPDKGVAASNSVRENANTDGVEAELDVILIGLRTDEIETSERIANDIVFPPPKTVFPSAIDRDLPGAVEIVVSNACNEAGADFDVTCECQVAQFADFTRRALRSNIPSRALTVTTAVDPVPSTPVLAGDPLSLRQAIEMANANGGRTTITFASTMTIRPSKLLPALTAPDITICGCAADCATASIPDKVTCSQTSQNEANVCDRKVTIDGQQKLEDGILIRSNRDVVRGLRVINFVHAGIVIQPVCPFDNTGFNRVEHNKLEDNTKAGVCVLDPPDKPFAIAHNIGNTISMNDISGSETPIDLGSAAPFTSSAPMSVCDGPTPNDVGDLDEGPNHLINFPDELRAVTVNNIVTITGLISTPSPAPLTVELFAVTAFKPANGSAHVTAVTFFKSVTANDDGSFAATGASASPILGYTATVTDAEGNTSELRTFCSGPALAAISPGSIRFARVDPTGAPPPHPESKEFVISNLGCSSLQITSVSLQRKTDRGRLREGCLDDSQAGSGFLSITPFPFGEDTADCGKPRPPVAPAIAIAPGLSETFQVEFNPVIPKVITHCQEQDAGGLSAADVLPSRFKSALRVTNSRDVLKLQLIGRVETAVKLIDPDAPSSPPKITLRRSGDDLFVTFSVFDSNLDVNKVNYEFFKTRDNQCTEEPVRAEITDRDLATAIANRNPKLVTGQSFMVIQRFSGASDNPEAGCVRVTVSDGEASPSVTSSLIGVPSPCASIASVSAHRSQGAIIVRPTIKLPGSSRGSRAAMVHRAASGRNKIIKTAGAQLGHASSRERRIR